MKSIIIPASKSITISNKFPNKSLNDETIMVGYEDKYNYLSLLFFDFSSIPDNISLVNSELVLFKCDNFFSDTNILFHVHPIYDYFSSYSTYSNPPRIFHSISKNLYPCINRVANTVNITDIVMLWTKNIIPNRGLAICTKKSRIIASFGSSKSKDSYLIPFIKVNFNKKEKTEDCCCCHKGSNFIVKVCNISSTPSDTGTIVEIKVTGTIEPNSIYVIIVEVVVQRASGKVDKYHTTDEYDNSYSCSPLSVDRSYTIAIVPRLDKGDLVTETNVYGSYKA